MAFYPLTKKTGGSDIGPKKNKPGRLVNTPFGKGPDGSPGTSVKLKGKPDSYIEFPNRKGKLDPRNSMTFVGYVNPKGKAGPIFNYKTDGFGVHIWQVRPKILFVRYVTRRKKALKPLVSTKLRRNAWNWIGTTYDQKTGMAKLFVNSKRVAQRYLGRIRLATSEPVRTGVRIRDRRYFRGRVACFQVYDRALTREQIRAAKRQCFKGCK